MAGRLVSALRGALPFAMVTVAGFAAAYSAMYVLLPAGTAEAAPRVPDVVGLPVDSARKLLEGRGFAIRIGASIAHGSVPEGHVITQSVEAGRESPEGSAIGLVVSAGNRRAAVPPVLGMSQDEAVLAVQGAGLEVGGVEQRASSLARGTVLDARPVPGALVRLPGVVTLIVSGGPSEVSVPDVLGQDLAAARAQLEQLGLVADSVGAEPFAGAAAGSVVAQAPVGGANVPAGTRIRLTVATP